MELLVIRHALPVRVDQTNGTADPVLSEEGIAQAELMADYLSSEPIDALFTSPMRRAAQTAAPLAEQTGLEPVVLDDVAEYDRHASAYVPAEELKAAGDPRWTEMVTGGEIGGVDPQAFYDRVVAALDGVVSAHPGKTVAVVCHGGVINAYFMHVLGMAYRFPGIFYPNYTSIHRFAGARSGERSVLAINETPHLRGTGLPVGMSRRG